MIQETSRLVQFFINPIFWIGYCAMSPNLASRVLTLSLSRLPGDMEKFYGHTVLLAETFVDPSRFKGSCYKACGWQSLGLTKGFSRIRKPNSTVTTWKKNHNPKEIFMKCISPDAREQLSADQMPDKGELHLPKEDISDTKLLSLHHFLEKYQDHRSKQGRRYPASCFFTLLCAANLCNYRGAAQVHEFGESLSQLVSWKFSESKALFLFLNPDKSIFDFLT